jgi:UDP-N-acetylmuramoylalanine--D-glutamate ligase
MASRDYFKGKRVAVVGLGPHGEMVEDVKYLIKAGAWVSIYDLKSEARLKNHLVFLRSVGLANYVCGSIPAEDLLDMDIIILSHEYPRDSSFLKGVYAQNDEQKEKVARTSDTDEQTVAQASEQQGKVIAVEYPETLFFKLAPPVTLVGVMGTCGKSTVISILTPLLQKVCETYDTQGLFTVDSESADGVLVHLKKIKSGDIVVMRIIDEMLPELHSMRISPHVAVFTTTPTVRGSLKSPFDVLMYQTYNNFIVASDEVIDATRSGASQARAKMLRTKAALVPEDWGFEGRGMHDRLNAALALQAARLFKVDDDMARHVLTDWKSLKGRLELIKKVKGVEFFNDTMSMTPDSTLAGITALSQGRNIILIFGGVDGGYEYRTLYSQLPRYVHTVVNIPGSGTMRQRLLLQGIEGVGVRSVPSIDEAVRTAFECSQKGDRVLFSPGFDAGGVEGSRVERGEKFVRAVRGL